MGIETLIKSMEHRLSNEIKINLKNSTIILLCLLIYGIEQFVFWPLANIRSTNNTVDNLL